MMEVFGGLFIGLLGSLHCAGMCGPLVTVFASGTGRMGVFAYHAGRGATYAAMGLLLGIFGRELRLAGLQEGLSIVTGVLMILLVTIPAGLQWGVGRIMRSLQTSFMSVFVRSSKNRSSFGRFVLGSLNGLLPCGLVYVALAGALGMADWLKGAAFMALFGIGTAPILVAIPLLSNRILSMDRARLNIWMKIGVVCVATLLILRGLSLGIPLISPELSGTNSMPCH